MKLPIIDNETAISAWNSYNEFDDFDASSVSIDYLDTGETDSLSDLELMELTDALEEIRIKFDDNISSQNGRMRFGGKVDAEIVTPIHSILSNLATPYQLSQPGFWLWFSNISHNGFFWRFIKWRMDSENQANWGIVPSLSQNIEGYFYRAWLRGHKMYDEKTPDPYHYAKLGTSDHWRSHILRQEFGKDKEFVKALLDTIYNSESEIVVKTNELRKVLIPAIRAWTASATFSHLTYDECKKLIKKLLLEEV
jgi:hypothetical protein